LFILNIPLIFHRKDPNKIEITAIRFMAGLKQGIGRGTAAFRRGGSPTVDRRWGRSSRGPRRFTRAAWRGLGWPEGLVPMVTPHGGKREIDGKEVSVLKGGDRGAGELHGNKVKLLEGLVWIEKRRGEMSTAARSEWAAAVVLGPGKEEESEWAGERGGRSNLIRV
jgi:hypothetical protein